MLPRLGFAACRRPQVVETAIFALHVSAGCMNSGLTGALPFPALGDQPRTKTRVDHRNSEEAALVRRVQARDELAFREIVERYQSKVFSIIYGILRNHNDAEDIAQQVFAKIYFSIQNFDFRSSLLTWIYKITVNECYDYLRKKRVRKLVYESDFSEDDSHADGKHRGRGSAPRCGRNARAPRSRDKLLSKISEEDRTLILLKEVEGHSVEELSQMTGMNENTIKVKAIPCPAEAREGVAKAFPHSAGVVGGVNMRRTQNRELDNRSAIGTRLPVLPGACSAD